MIESQVTVEVRIACDHCGRPATTGYYATETEAREAAKAEGYIIHCWLFGTYPRLTGVCPQCYTVLANKDGNVVEPDHTL